VPTIELLRQNLGVGHAQPERDDRPDVAQDRGAHRGLKAREIPWRRLLRTVRFGPWIRAALAAHSELASSRWVMS
jgi:hypothetical protein